MHLLSFQKVMAERYGYALDLGDTSCGWEGDLALANGLIAQKIALKRSDPRRYPLSIQVHRPLVYPDRSCPGGYQDPTFKTKYPSAYLQNGQVSPEAPVAMWQELAQISEARLKKIVAKVATEVPVSPRVDVILNGGEYGVGVWTDDDAKWLGDAAVASSLAARFGLASAQAATDTQKFLYLSENKRRLEQVVTQAHVAANPGGMYVWYQTWSAGWRERWGGWWRYTHDYEVIRPLSTPTNLAYPSIYYRDFSSQVTGWTGDKDALSQLTNAAAWQLPAGAPLQYLSTCGGWPHSGSGFPADQLLASDASYMGYLKMAYAVGLVGATGGYFTNPGWGSEATGASATMPNWVRQLVTLGEVHALYSHVEALLRDGTLLPGPRKHKWSKGKPAYELDALVNGQADPLVRVVARRANAQARWLVALWAVDEIDRDVSVTVETLPAQTLRARAAGSVYVLTQESGGLRVELLDQEPMAPTDTLLPTDAW
jgi:hypothetical protein